MLHPWTETLLNTLLHLAPLPTGAEPVSQTKPPSRVVLEKSSIDKLNNAVDPLSKDPRYYQASVKANDRITASDWYQDVRHFEFNFRDDIQYDPGDVAIIHPVATNDDVDSFLEIVHWLDRADVPYVIRRHVEGTTEFPVFNRDADLLLLRQTNHSQNFFPKLAHSGKYLLVIWTSTLFHDVISFNICVTSARKSSKRRSSTTSFHRRAL